MRKSMFVLVATAGLAVAATGFAQSSQMTGSQHMGGSTMNRGAWGADMMHRPGMMHGPGMMMHGPMYPDMSNGPMMGMMQGPGHYVEGRIAFLKAELGITGSQEQAWGRFADAMRRSASTLQTMHDKMMSGDGTPANLVDRLQWKRQMISARLQALEDFEATALPLYEVLTSEQKRVADDLMGVM